MSLFRRRKPGQWVLIDPQADFDRVRMGKVCPFVCFINSSGYETPVSDFTLSGEITPKNFRFVTSKKGNENGLHSWIEVYGEVKIDEKTSALFIKLQNPPKTKR